MSNGIKSDCPFPDTLLFGNGQLGAFYSLEVNERVTFCPTNGGTYSKRHKEE